MYFGCEAGIGRAGAGEPAQRRFRAIEAVEVAAQDDAAIGLQANGVRGTAQAISRLKGGILRAVGVQAGHVVGPRAVEIADDENLPIGLEQHRRVVVARHGRAEVGRSRETAVERAPRQQPHQPQNSIRRVVEGQVAVGQHLAIGLKHQAHYFGAGLEGLAKGGIHAAVGIEPDQAIGGLAVE